MRVPQDLIHRVVSLDEGGVRVVVDDDRKATRWAVGLGAVAVACLSAGLIAGGPLWTWVGIGSVPVLGVVATLTAPWLRTPHTIDVLGDEWHVDDTIYPLQDVLSVHLQWETLLIRTRDEDVELHLQGEDPSTRVAITAWLKTLLAEDDALRSEDRDESWTDPTEPWEATREPPSFPEYSED
ncbi:MAG: hypothetical protein KTR31_03500 [Myxococcales bacterium]|nr:hypothetical protein [Myxococcales bacterium]